MIEIEEKAVPVIVDIKGGEVTANITPAHDVSVTVGESAVLEATAAVNYIKSGEAEIDAYVNSVSKPQIVSYIEDVAEPLAEQIVSEKAEPLINTYVSTSVLPNINDVVSDKINEFNDNAVTQTELFDDNAATAIAQATASATNAANNAQLAMDWATKASIPVEGDLYSAKYYANKAGLSAGVSVNCANDAANYTEYAATSATAAEQYKRSAAASATTAANEANLAEQWAVKMDGKIDNVDYSAKYYAAQAEEAAAGVGNPANRDLSNLTATGEAKFTAKQDVISDLSTIRSGATAGATAVQPADLANYVDTSTNQTISGAKTFTRYTRIQTTGLVTGLVAQNTDIEKGTAPSSNTECRFYWHDKNSYTVNDRIGGFTTIYKTTGAICTTMQAFKPAPGDSTRAEIYVEYPVSGNPYTYAPDPTDTYADTNGTQIATTGWTATNFVNTTGDQTINGLITFTNNPIVYRGNPYLLLSSSSLTKGTNPSGSSINSVVAFTGNDKGTASASSLGRFAFQVATNGTVFTQMRCYKNEASSTTAVYFSLYYPTSDSAYAETSAYLRPSGDNSLNLGDSSHRWKQLYAGTTTISTSDERLKQGIEAIPDAVLDAWGEVDFYRYKFNDAVAEKGFDNARYHTGMVAQRIERIFAEHGLNAFDYGLLCFDEWQAEPEVRDEENEIIKPAVAAGDRYSLRYEECLCMEAAYQRRRADRIEARLAALEARL